jgi:hypothetical protein
VNDRDSPQMSVVIVADHYETIRKTMRHIRAQTVRDRLEIVTGRIARGVAGRERGRVFLGKPQKAGTCINSRRAGVKMSRAGT